MEIQPIGKGLFRTTIKAQRARDDLAKVPGITVDGMRVIFPESFIRTVESIGSGKCHRAHADAIQTSIFGTEKGVKNG